MVFVVGTSFIDMDSIEDHMIMQKYYAERIQIAKWFFLPYSVLF